MFDRELFEIHADEAHGVIGSAPGNVEMLTLHSRDELLGEKVFESFFPDVLETFSVRRAYIPRSSPEKSFFRVKLHHFDFGLAR